jgi:hypothetical protein
VPSAAEAVPYAERGEGRSVRDRVRSKVECFRQDVVIRWCLRRDVERRLSVYSHYHMTHAHYCKIDSSQHC